MAPPSIPLHSNYQDDREYQYLCHFRDTTAVELSAGFTPTLWNVLVLNACDNASIRKLAVATAALSISVKYEPKSSNNERDFHHGYALEKYGQALSEIRSMVATGQDHTRTALISALLIFCFESLHGSIDQGFTHIQSAIDMIMKRISSIPRPYHFSRSNPTTTQPNSMIDDELLMAFMRLERPALALMSQKCGHPPPLSNRIFQYLFASEELDIPNSFSSLAEARAYLEDIMWRVTITNDMPDPMGTLWSEDNEQTSTTKLGLAPYQMQQSSLRPSVLSPDLSVRVTQWHDAFSPLLNHSMSPAGESLFLPAATLHVQALSTDLLVSGVFSTQFSMPTSTMALSPLTIASPQSSSSRSSPAPTAEDLSMFPAIHAIFNFSRRIISHPAFRKGFVFDDGIIPSLVQIGTRCPDQSMRREATSLLRSIVPRREGLWDSRDLAEAGENRLATEDSQAGSEILGPLLLGGFGL